MELFLLLTPPLLLAAVVTVAVVLRRQRADTRLRKTAVATGGAAMAAVVLAIPSAVSNWQAHQPRPSGGPVEHSELWSWVVNVVSFPDYLSFIVLFALSGLLVLRLASRLVVRK